MQVEILMATKNGAAFLPGQLASISAQRGVDWHVAASDDGSKDDTPAILAQFAARCGRLRLVEGPGQGAAANFLSLLGGDAPPGFTALSDQDDIWLPGRLARAAAMLGDFDHFAPRVYASRTVLVDAAGRRLGLSRGPARPPGFRNALVQNVLRGNTIVMNAAARALLGRAATASLGVPFHDWWIYALLTGAGAEVIFDDRPGVLYRQHARNVIGAHRGFRAAGSRIAAVLDGRYGGWLRRNATGLARAGDILTPRARGELAMFMKVFEARPLRRLAALHRSGARRMEFAGTSLVFGAGGLGRL